MSFSLNVCLAQEHKAEFLKYYSQFFDRKRVPIGDEKKSK